jgi:integrase
MPQRQFPDSMLSRLTPPKKGEQLRIVKDQKITGLTLRITDSGARNWYLSYRARGTNKQRHLHLGPLDQLSATDARRRARAEWKRILAGVDPHEEKLKARAVESAKREAPIIDEGGDYDGEKADKAAIKTSLAHRYIAEHAIPNKREESVYEDKSLLRQWIRPVLGKKKVLEVTNEDVQALHDKITKAGTPVRADAAVALLSKMFSCAATLWRWRRVWLPCGQCGETVPDRHDRCAKCNAVLAYYDLPNPCKGVKKNGARKRKPKFDMDALTNFIKALNAHPNVEGTNTLRLLFLTGARRGEWLGARWDQFRFNEANSRYVWTKPATATKQKREHETTLNAPATQLLSEIRAEAEAGHERAKVRERKAAKERHPKKKAKLLNGAARARLRADSEFVFPGYGNGDKGVNNITKVWYAVREAMGRPELRIHDLRHAFGSALGDANLSPPIIMALLGHSQLSTTQRYIHVSDDPLLQAAEKVGALYTAAATGKTAEVHELPQRKA